MADTTTAPKHDVTTDGTDAVTTMVSHFVDNSTIKSNGIREVSKAGLDAALLSQGVSAVDVKKVHDAYNHATTAAAMLASDDLVSKLEGATKDQLADDDYRRGLNAVVRLPTAGGKTEVQVTAEKVNNIPFRGEGEPAQSIKHGVVRVSVNGTGRISKDLPGTISDRMKAALKITG